MDIGIFDSGLGGLLGTAGKRRYCLTDLTPWSAELGREWGSGEFERVSLG